MNVNSNGLRAAGLELSLDHFPTKRQAEIFQSPQLGNRFSFPFSGYRRSLRPTDFFDPHRFDFRTRRRDLLRSIAHLMKVKLANKDESKSLSCATG